MARKASPGLGKVIHIEIYVVPKRRRAQFRRRAREPIAYARDVTGDRGGSGPHFYLVDEQPATPGAARLGELFKVKPNEDLWLEVTFYPSRAEGRATVRKIWKTERIAASLRALESLNARPKGGWAIGNASLQVV